MPGKVGDSPGRGQRRQFLCGLGGLGAAALLPSCATPQATMPATRIIDTHHHFYPPEYQQAWLGWEDEHKVPHFPQQTGWTRSKSLEEMDQNNVGTAVLSLASTPGVWMDRGAAEATRLARLCNEYGADMVRSYPGRYGQFAALPMLDVDASLKELEYALDVLKADGIGLQTSYGDRWPGDASFRPVFEELNRRKALVYFHPLGASCCTGLRYGAFPALIEYPHDTTRAVVSLLSSGSFARFRDIRWLFSHAGGTIPMLAGRIEGFLNQRKDRPEFAPEGIEEEFRRLYYDTANATHPSAMAALLKLVPGSHVVFGTDYPYVPTGFQRANLEKSALSAAELLGIERDNATALMPRLRG